MPLPPPHSPSDPNRIEPPPPPRSTPGAAAHLRQHPRRRRLDPLLPALPVALYFRRLPHSVPPQVPFFPIAGTLASAMAARRPSESSVPTDSAVPFSFPGWTPTLAAAARGLNPASPLPGRAPLAATVVPGARTRQYVSPTPTAAARPLHAGARTPPEATRTTPDVVPTRGRRLSWKEEARLRMKVPVSTKVILALYSLYPCL
jgi:hypothetical protein